MWNVICFLWKKKKTYLQCVDVSTKKSRSISTHADTADISVVSALRGAAKWGNHLHFDLLIYSLFVKLTGTPIS